MNVGHSKVRAVHLKRDAWLYVRQSTVRQVFENTESTKRQYALRQRAVALGWPVERVHVIDSDLGHSGASAADREGFKQLITEVGLGRVGVVLGLEVSRLARNNKDWHHLLELCAFADTLILDEDGLYDPNDFNDRLLLGLKGTMSEAELHFLRARLDGGKLNKAKRGELACPLPVGFVYDERGKVRLDADSQVREAIGLFFRTYQRTNSAYATVKHFRDEGLLFPRRLRTRLHKGELVWGELCSSRALQVLHNPRYAGAFFFGRHQTRKNANGGTAWRKRPREEWLCFIPDAHEGYISLEEYENIQRRLIQGAQAHGLERTKSPPREGPALLQGIVICGLCGLRMAIRYLERGRRGIGPVYICQRDGIEHSRAPCQTIPGANVDQAISDLLLDMVAPMALEVALAVQNELFQRVEEEDRLREKQVERMRYEADLGRLRYMQVDPNNRLVADVLEAEWNEKLRILELAQEDFEKQRRTNRFHIDEKERERIIALASDFPRLWKDPGTCDRDRKRMVRLLIEDVTLVRKETITAHVRFKGGTTTTIIVPAPKPYYKICQTSPEVVAEVDRLLDDYTDGQIASILNEKGLRSGKGAAFNLVILEGIRRSYHLKSRHDRLRERGLLNVNEMASMLGVCTRTVSAWRKSDLIRGFAYNDKKEYLFEPPGTDRPTKYQGKKPGERQPFTEFIPDRVKEVQYEA